MTNGAPKKILAIGSRFPWVVFQGGLNSFFSPTFGTLFYAPYNGLKLKLTQRVRGLKLGLRVKYFRLHLSYGYLLLTAALLDIALKTLHFLIKKISR